MLHRIRRSALLRCLSHRTLARALVAAAAMQAGCDGPQSEGVPNSPTVPTRASAGVVRGDPLLDYEITVENLRGLYHAHHNLYRLSQREPGLLEELEEEISEIPPAEFEKTVAAIGAVPAVRDALGQAKLSPRDFYLTQFNLMNAVAVLQARGVGRSDNLPDVSERNVEVVRQNPHEVDRLMTERRPKPDKDR